MPANQMPEEQLRKRLLKQMVENLGYPKSLISVEKELKHFAGNQKNIPKRRIDILCFDRLMHPLLLVECKAKPIDIRAVIQAIGYNAVIKARLVALAQPDAIFLRWKKDGQTHYQWFKTLPSFDDLLQWE
jgi:Type I restriction enzyme R protein N terminus (HSDR_N)